MTVSTTLWVIFGGPSALPSRLSARKFWSLSVLLLILPPLKYFDYILGKSLKFSGSSLPFLHLYISGLCWEEGTFIAKMH